jgi:hypothetical protein
MQISHIFAVLGLAMTGTALPAAGSMAPVAPRQSSCASDQQRVCCRLAAFTCTVYDPSQEECDAFSVCCRYVAPVRVASMQPPA